MRRDTEKPKYACIYCRLSYAPDGSLEKVERQEGDCRDLGQKIDWGVCCVYSDNNKSAWQRNRKRAEWGAMLDSLQPGNVCPRGNKHDGILIYHGDRLIRQPWDLELLLKVADDRHLPLASPQGTRDLNSEDDRFILRIEAAQACRASADTSRRVKRDARARSEKGGAGTGSNRPFGYGVPTGNLGRTGKPLYDIEKLNRKEAAIGRAAIKRFLAGQSQGGVIAWLNTKCTTTAGNPWKANAFRAWLSAPRTAGLVEYDGKLMPARWKGLMTPEQREDVLALLQAQSDTYGYSGRERLYLLTGKAADCGGCAGPLYTKPANKTGDRLYYCKTPRCPSPVARNVRLLDAYVVGRVLRRLNEPAFLAAVHASLDEPGLGGEIAALQRRKTADTAVLQDLADHPEVDTALLALGIASYDRKIAQLRAQMAATSAQRLLVRMAGITLEQWDLEPIDVRAETVRSLFQVTVLPAGRRGPGFDPASVRMKRRQLDD
ncbi:recombinase family protein [Kribbella sp. NPDC051718]|uniref:recombinase family protein n=1 Tax=Kribbella sp. NPDC051718 TaxID=3155168 RepID=UPI0034208129